MASTASKPEDAVSTDILPKVLGDSPIFQAVRTDNMPAVRNLSEAGLTEVVFVSTDRRGKFQAKITLVSFETRDAIMGLLDDERVA